MVRDSAWRRPPSVTQRGIGLALLVFGVGIASLLLVLGGIVIAARSEKRSVRAERSSSAAEAAHDARRSAVSPKVLRQIRADFRGFEGATWYVAPGQLRIVGDTLVAKTSFFPDAEGRALARMLCNVLNANYVASPARQYGLRGVVVYAHRDPVAHLSVLSAHC
jgi:hypothetical protein